MEAGAVRPDSVVATLAAVGALHATRTDADAGLFELAAHFADLHSADSLHPAGFLGAVDLLASPAGGVLAGVERAVVLGGVGTPRVAEFAVAELGARMQLGTWSARRYLADALDVRHRLPLIWERVCAREARVGYARLVAARTRHLSPEAAGLVDAAMVEFVDGSLPWGRFESRLEARVVAADPAAAAAREADRVQEQFAKRTRSSEAGTAGFYVRSTVGVVARLDATVRYVADALAAFGDRDDLDQRKVKAVLVLCNPAKAVELLAAYTALRARSLDVELPLADHPEPPQPTEPADTADPSTDPSTDPSAPAPAPEVELDALDRMDAFAGKVGFEPTRLPASTTPTPAATAPTPAATAPTPTAPTPTAPTPTAPTARPPTVR